MTYAEWRQFGHVSRLSEALVCKGPGANINTGNSIAGQQLGVASQAGQQQSQLYGQMQQMLSPLIKQQTGLASGNRQDALAAAMPVISQLSSGWQGAKQGIMDSMPAGASRDSALATLATQKATGIGNAQAQMVQNAPGTLAQIGSGLGQMSLQDLGAQLSGLSGGAQTNYNTGQMAAAQQASLLNFFGGLVKSATGLINPFSLFGGGSASGGAGSSSLGAEGR